MNFNNLSNNENLMLENNLYSNLHQLANQLIDDLKAGLDKLESLNQLPANTLFTLDRYEGNFAVCENRANR